MSFKREMILWLRDIRQFAFHPPQRKDARVIWATIVVAWTIFLSVLAVSLFQPFVGRW